MAESKSKLIEEEGAQEEAAEIISSSRKTFIDHLTNINEKRSRDAIAGLITLTVPKGVEKPDR